MSVLLPFVWTDHELMGPGKYTKVAGELQEHVLPPGENGGIVDSILEMTGELITFTQNMGMES
jgi:hypothetical protein